VTRHGALLATRSEYVSTGARVRAERKLDCSTGAASRTAASSKQLELDGLVALAQALKMCGLSVRPSLAFRAAGRARLMSRIAATPSTASQSTAK
jgi:hypothetical protein